MQPTVAHESLRTQILADGGWVVLGQIGVALGTLIGIRLLTEVVPPDVFGGVTLVSGVVALGIGVSCSPVFQAVLRAYPESKSGDEIAALRKNAISILWVRGAWGYAAFLTGWLIFSYFREASLSIGILVAALLAVESVRSLESTFLSAARRQRPFALISASEAWGRPLVAIVCVGVLGPTIQAVLTGYLATSLVVLVCFYMLLTPEGMHGSLAQISSDSGLKERLEQYSLPLVPLGLIGWVTGVGDRYMLAGMLGIEAAGVYAAIYGLISRPFLLLGNAVELTFRPIYNQAVATGKPFHDRRVLFTWLGIVGGLGSVGFVILAGFADVVVRLLLAKEYRASVILVPWIAGGYLLLILSYVFEKVCYAYGTTRLVLLIQLCGALLSLSISYTAIRSWGLMGAATAVPIYFGLQLLLSVAAASHTNSSRAQSTVRE